MFARGRRPRDRGRREDREPAGWALAFLGGLGIVLVVDGVLGAGWPWTILAGVFVYFAAYEVSVRSEPRQGR